MLLNAGLQRCDGIIVTADGPPLLVPLPELRLADVEARAAELTEATHDASSFTGELRRQRVLTELLGWLWDTAVEPVLDAVERCWAARPRRRPRVRARRRAVRGRVDKLITYPA